MNKNTVYLQEIQNGAFSIGGQHFKRCRKGSSDEGKFFTHFKGEKIILESTLACRLFYNEQIRPLKFPKSNNEREKQTNPNIGDINPIGATMAREDFLNNQLKDVNFTTIKK